MRVVLCFLSSFPLLFAHHYEIVLSSHLPSHRHKVQVTLILMFQTEATKTRTIKEATIEVTLILLLQPKVASKDWKNLIVIPRGRRPCFTSSSMG